MMKLAKAFKEIMISISRHTLGEDKTYDILIRRGIKVRHLEKYYFHKYENTKNNNKTTATNTQTLVFMADGKWTHGGLTDRLRGIASTWSFAKKHGLNFKIFHTSPFELDAILKPNQIQWKIQESELDWNNSKPVLLYREDFDNEKALERQLDSCHSQFHVYSCVDSVGAQFPNLFNELFTPSDMLQDALALYAKLEPKTYGAVSFRMQNLLGDFYEGNFDQLDCEYKKQELVASAMKTLDNIASRHPQWNYVLVTADSPALLEEATKHDKVVSVSGKSVHIDFCKSKTEQDYLKAFVEFMLISKAQKAYLYHNKKYNTYLSNFPKYAASLGAVPFEVESN